MRFVSGTLLAGMLKENGLTGKIMNNNLSFVVALLDLYAFIFIKHTGYKDLPYTYPNISCYEISASVLEKHCCLRKKMWYLKEKYNNA